MNIRTNINKIKQIENGKENFKNKKKKKKLVNKYGQINKNKNK